MYNSAAGNTTFLPPRTMSIPGFPERRAIFVETDVELSVYAHWGEAIAEDLRHEVAHGCGVPPVPARRCLPARGMKQSTRVASHRSGLGVRSARWTSGCWGRSRSGLGKACALSYGSPNVASTADRIQSR